MSSRVWPCMLLKSISNMLNGQACSWRVFIALKVWMLVSPFFLQYMLNPQILIPRGSSNGWSGDLSYGQWHHQYNIKGKPDISKHWLRKMEIFATARSNAHTMGTRSATLVLPMGTQKYVVEILPSLPSGLYYTKPAEGYVAMKAIFRKIWHDRLGHPELGMMRKIINNFAGHRDFSNPKDFYLHHMCKGEASH